MLFSPIQNHLAMNDAELYEFFKSKGDAFNEMPSDEMWNKITTTLNNKHSNGISKAFISKLFLLIAALIGVSYALQKNDDDVVPNPKVSKFTTTTIKTDSVLSETKSIEKPKKFIHFNNVNPKKIVSDKPVLVPFRRIDTITKTVLPIISEKTEAETKPITPEIINIPDTKIQTIGSRIVISSDKKLTKTEFEQLVQRSIKANEGAEGKLLIVKAIGHKPFKSQIFTLKTDTIQTSLLNFSIPKNTIRQMDSVK